MCLRKPKECPSKKAVPKDKQDIVGMTVDEAEALGWMGIRGVPDEVDVTPAGNKAPFLCGRLGEPEDRVITIANKSSKQLAFKAIASEKTQFRAEPAAGIVAAGESATVTYTYLNERKYPAFDKQQYFRVFMSFTESDVVPDGFAAEDDGTPKKFEGEHFMLATIFYKRWFPNLPDEIVTKPRPNGELIFRCGDPTLWPTALIYIQNQSASRSIAFFLDILGDRYTFLVSESYRRGIIEPGKTKIIPVTLIKTPKEIAEMPGLHLKVDWVGETKELPEQFRPEYRASVVTKFAGIAAIIPLLSDEVPLSTDHTMLAYTPEVAASTGKEIGATAREGGADKAATLA